MPAAKFTKSLGELSKFASFLHSLGVEFSSTATQVVKDYIDLSHLKVSVMGPMVCLSGGRSESLIFFWDFPFQQVFC